jgi:hypothetical protein
MPPWQTGTDHDGGDSTSVGSGTISVTASPQWRNARLNQTIRQKRSSQDCTVLARANSCLSGLCLRDGELPVRIIIYFTSRLPEPTSFPVTITFVTFERCCRAKVLAWVTQSSRDHCSISSNHESCGWCVRGKAQPDLCHCSLSDEC